MKAWQLLAPFSFASIERPGTIATRSEVRRWLRQGWVKANAEPLGDNEEVDFPLISLILHNADKRVTLV